MRIFEILSSRLRVQERLEICMLLMSIIRTSNGSAIFLEIILCDILHLNNTKFERYDRVEGHTISLRKSTCPEKPTNKIVNDICRSGKTYKT